MALLSKTLLKCINTVTVRESHLGRGTGHTARGKRVQREWQAKVNAPDAGVFPTPLRNAWLNYIGTRLDIWVSTWTFKLDSLDRWIETSRVRNRKLWGRKQWWKTKIKKVTDEKQRGKGWKVKRKEQFEVLAARSPHYLLHTCLSSGCQHFSSHS